MASTAQTSDSPPDRSRRSEASGSGSSTALINAPHSSLFFHRSHIVQNNEQRGTLRKGFKILCENIDGRLLHDHIDRDVEEATPSTSEAQVVDEIMEWAENPAHLAQAACAYSPTLPGGTSTTSHAITERCHEKGLLLASVFLPGSTSTSTSAQIPSQDKKRDTETRRRVVATIAYQIALALPATRPFIEEAVERDPAIFHRSIRSQVQHLVQEPLNRATASLTFERCARLPFIIVLDGLDPGNRWHQVLLRTISSPPVGGIAVRPVAVLHTLTSHDDRLFGHLSDTPLRLFIPSQPFTSYEEHGSGSGARNAVYMITGICVLFFSTTPFPIGEGHR